jgi:hypothetical protein
MLSSACATPATQLFLHVFAGDTAVGWRQHEA